MDLRQSRATSPTGVPPHPCTNARRAILHAETLVAEEIVAQPHLPPRGITTRRQLAITFRGAFEFQVGRAVSWVDPTRLLLADANQSFVDRHVVPGVGHQSVVLTPAPEVLDQLWRDVPRRFALRTAPCSPRIQMLVQLLRRAHDPLAAEEIGIAILGANQNGDEATPGFDTRCVRRAKAMLHEAVDGRFTLTRIAREVGVSPVHLTQSFNRAEGIPLYRYQTRLRLSRALDRLPGCDDISDLAFELGFSSHSHFTAAFRSATGVTPSRYRRMAEWVPANLGSA